ncbi:unnamed protein product, partial [Coccothraustes coccothraustes]
MMGNVRGEKGGKREGGKWTEGIPGFRSSEPGFPMDPQLWRLALLPVLAAGGILSAPKTPVLGIIGDKVLLPCQVGSAPVPEDFSVHWTFHLGRSQRIPVGSYNGKGRREEPDERYRGRAELFHGEFRAGNASLLLRDIRSSDQGSYSCQVSFQGESWEVLVDLEVAAVGEAPTLILRGRDAEALGLSCRASGWFPPPELLWLDGRGHSRPEPAAATATATPGGLFSVEGSVRIRPGADLEISCRILNRRLNASRASRIRVHEAFFPSVSRWLQIFLAVLFLSLALISGISCLLHQRRRAKALLAKIQFKQRLGQLNAELDFWEARSHAAPVALDPEARLLDLGDAREPLPRAALVARDALGAGNGYWEVELGRQRSWAVGVLREPPGPRDPRDSRDPPWLWALCASQGRLFSASRALGNHPRDLPVLQNHPRDLPVPPEHPRDLPVLGDHPRDLPVLGVLLDREQARLEFYDAERRERLAGLALGAAPGHREPPAGIPPGRLFPFVAQGEEGALSIRPKTNFYQFSSKNPNFSSSPSGPASSGFSRSHWLSALSITHRSLPVQGRALPPVSRLFAVSRFPIGCPRCQSQPQLPAPSQSGRVLPV